ncbi:chemotaxis protein CheD [Geochorda subterranea]|uniref:Probable chemoreceptor glutamine deamidase CheD n=1 Tax=Geochorda subterranea TaxID=3109564 RepID=A0ABZ1BMC9_9FIRM|nr:chemotaxis protein CheD [Limnochorda sp. LNt]WRP13977.1 chemotaxis protein CheD [Limnochorda sp. LNt]
MIRASPDQATLVTVRIGQLHVLKGRGVLAAIGLGSCVGVALYDPVSRVAGLAHIFLPSSQNGRLVADAPARYADTGVPALVEAMAAAGARTARLQAKLAGGAQLFLRGDHATLEVGRRNVEAVRAALRALGIPVVAHDVGGSRGRTMRLFADTGRVVVTTLGREAREL